MVVADSEGKIVSKVAMLEEIVEEVVEKMIEQKPFKQLEILEGIEVKASWVPILL